MNKGEKMKSPTKDDIREQKVTWKNKCKQAMHELKQFQWIDINKDQPTLNDVCNVRVKTDHEDFVTSGLYKPEYGLNAFDCLIEDIGNVEVYGVTHWMPLPQPPK